MPRLSDSIASDISYMALLSFLQPYMQDVDKFNANRTKISEAVNAFLTQTHNNAPSRYTAKALLEAYQNKTTVIEFTEEETTKNIKSLKEFEQLHDEIIGFSADFSYDLRAKYKTKEDAQAALKINQALYLWAERMAAPENKDAKVIRLQMTFYIEKHYTLKATLQQFQERIDANRASIFKQEQKQGSISYWAHLNLKHRALIQHLSNRMEANTTENKAYERLLSMRNEDTRLPQEEIQSIEKALVSSTEVKSENGTTPETIAKALPIMLSNVAIKLCHEYTDFDAQGNPVQFKYERALSAALYGLSLALLSGLVITTVLTLVPVIPAAASTGLNQLYSGLFAASSSPVFTFTEIYLISLAFVVAIDLLVLAAAKYWEKHGVEHKIALKKQYIAPKLETKIAAYTDAQVVKMDDDLVSADRPTRKTVISLYGQPSRHLLLGTYDKVKADKAPDPEPGAKPATRFVNPFAKIKA